MGKECIFKAILSRWTKSSLFYWLLSQNKSEYNVHPLTRWISVQLFSYVFQYCHSKSVYHALPFSKLRANTQDFAWELQWRLKRQHCCHGYHTHFILFIKPDSKNGCICVELMYPRRIKFVDSIPGLPHCLCTQLCLSVGFEPESQLVASFLYSCMIQWTSRVCMPTPHVTEHWSIKGSNSHNFIVYSLFSIGNLLERSIHSFSDDILFW